MYQIYLTKNSYTNYFKFIYIFLKGSVKLFNLNKCDFSEYFSYVRLYGVNYIIKKYFCVIA